MKRLRVTHAIVWSMLWTLTVFVIVGLLSMGDCGEPMERCMNARRQVGLIGLVTYLVVLAFVNWLILRRRDHS